MVLKAFAAALLFAWAFTGPIAGACAQSTEQPRRLAGQRYLAPRNDVAGDHEIRRLPDIRLSRLDPNLRMPERDIDQADEPVYSPSFSSDPLIVPDEVEVTLAAATRPSAFQMASITATRVVDETFSITDLEAFGVWALPVTPQAPLILTPGFGVHDFSAEEPPGIPTLPEEVFDFYLDFRVLYKHSERFSIDLAVTPGYYSDLHNKSSDAFRIGARALTITTWTPTLKTIGGVVYLDRDDYPFVPGAGLIWTPTADWDIHIAMPKPKAAYRFDANPGRERWVYLAGEFGGGAWAFEYDGRDDVMNYSDLRLLTGIEQRGPAGPAFRLEAGYVFARKVEFNRAPEKFEPDDAFLIRGALTY